MDTNVLTCIISLTIAMLIAGCSCCYLLHMRGLLKVSNLSLVVFVAPIIIFLTSMYGGLVKQPPDIFPYSNTNLMVYFITMPMLYFYMYSLVTRLLEDEQRKPIVKPLLWGSLVVLSLSLIGVAIVSSVLSIMWLIGLLGLVLGYILRQFNHRLPSIFGPLTFLLISSLNTLVLMLTIQSIIFIKLGLYIVIWVFPFIYTHIRTKTVSDKGIWIIPLSWIMVIILGFFLPIKLTLYLYALMIAILMAIMGLTGLELREVRAWWIASTMIQFVWIIQHVIMAPLSLLIVLLINSVFLYQGSLVYYQKRLSVQCFLFASLIGFITLCMTEFALWITEWTQWFNFPQLFYLWGLLSCVFVLIVIRYKCRDKGGLFIDITPMIGHKKDVFIWGIAIIFFGLWLVQISLSINTLRQWFNYPGLFYLWGLLSYLLALVIRPRRITHKKSIFMLGAIIVFLSLRLGQDAFWMTELYQLFQYPTRLYLWGLLSSLLGLGLILFRISHKKSIFILAVVFIYKLLTLIEYALWENTTSNWIYHMLVYTCSFIAIFLVITRYPDLKKLFRKRLLQNIVLVVCSILLCLVCLELTLRYLYPKYRYAADVVFSYDSYRIKTHKEGSYYYQQHPDNQTQHLVYHNNIGGRQHRDIDLSALDQDGTVAFFGDSYTENIRIPVQFSLSESLNYLLNQTSKHDVLNFGMDGSSIDNSYLNYTNLPFKDKLNHVFYLFCTNDIRDIYENELFSLGEDNSLLLTPYSKVPFWLQILGKCHVTYFFLEKWRHIDIYRLLDIGYFNRQENSLDGFQIEKLLLSKIQATKAYEPAGVTHKRVFERTVTIFARILQEWKSEVESQENNFYIVILPTYKMTYEVLKEILGDSVIFINLYDRYEDGNQGYSYWDSIYRFDTDPHWNENGNTRAAIELYKFLSPKLNLARHNTDTLKTMLLPYFDSFPEGRPSLLPEDEITMSKKEKEHIYRTYSQAEQRLTK